VFDEEKSVRIGKVVLNNFSVKSLLYLERHETGKFDFFHAYSGGERDSIESIRFVKEG
jgi:hypothetical protein